MAVETVWKHGHLFVRLMFLFMNLIINFSLIKPQNESGDDQNASKLNSADLEVNLDQPWTEVRHQLAR